jgi:D-alanine--poly(phosphoribitol) ligase subunit 1
MRLIGELIESISRNKARNAFFINGEYYTYNELSSCISAIRQMLAGNTDSGEKRVGLIANDDLETYASIIALWLEGKAYVPLGPSVPHERNRLIVDVAGIRTILSSDPEWKMDDIMIVETRGIRVDAADLNAVATDVEEDAFVLFTSGTTGLPKGVPITRKNVTGFVDAFWKIGFKVDHNDRFLQMFDITFDLSVMSYLIPLLKGACVYTLSDKKIKFNQIYDLFEEKNITFSLMVPSILHFFRPYFDELSFPSLRYSLFCGEALHLDIVEEWSRSVPNAAIYNVYGPTEDTIFCSYYQFNSAGYNKSYNGIMSLGKSMSGSEMMVVNDENDTLPAGETGEICLGGIQLTKGYLNNDEKNRLSFFIQNIDGTEKKWYKTGDLGFCDSDGDFLFAGRKDHQVKIQGYRVELAEIEFHAKKFLEKFNVVAVDYISSIGSTELGMAIEAVEFNKEPVLEYLGKSLPGYMIPKELIFIEKFPLNQNGKIERNRIKSLFK